MENNVATPIVKEEQLEAVFSFDVDLQALSDARSREGQRFIRNRLRSLGEASGTVVSGEHLKFTFQTDDELLAVTLRDGIVALASYVSAIQQKVDARAAFERAEQRLKQGAASRAASRATPPDTDTDKVAECECSGCRASRAVFAAEKAGMSRGEAIISVIVNGF
jgi:hypothetical protein